MALPLLAFLVAGGCGESNVIDPSGGFDTAPGAGDAGLRATLSSARSGPLNVKKDCTGYTGLANQTCTITHSNVKAIEVGSVITYLQGATADGMLNTDIVLDPPGPGNNVAYGHCTVSLVTGIGECRLSGGTGKFTHINARVAVTPLGWPNFAWDGTYSFAP
ncbi:MAG: hypothetical protein ABIS15_08590 [Gemmatimonadaceae bacterium]